MFVDGARTDAAISKLVEKQEKQGAALTSKVEGWKLHLAQAKNGLVEATIR